MNVLYQCPTCSNRLFAKPGGTNLHCSRHPDTLFEQVEEYNGPDYLNKDEQGKTKSRDIVGPGNERLGHDDTPEAKMNQLREDYRRESHGLVADKRWGEARIRDEIAAVVVENEQAAAEEAEQERLAAEMKEGVIDESDADGTDSVGSDSSDSTTVVEVMDSELDSVEIVEQPDIPEPEPELEDV